MATVDTSARNWIGNRLLIEGGSDLLPEGAALPVKLSLCSVHVRRGGVYLGQSWYLQTYGRSGGATVDVISGAGDEPTPVETMLDFLKAHGYREIDVLLYARR